MTPTCRSCGREMEERPDSAYTPEARWCGTWWDHPPVPISECGQRMSSVLDPSEALIAQSAPNCCSHSRCPGGSLCCCLED